jgi:hypothetical protein
MKQLNTISIPIVIGGLYIIYCVTRPIDWIINGFLWFAQLDWGYWKEIG